MQEEEILQEQTESSPPAQSQAPISEVKKTALMRYLAVMFAVAFMLVLVSFLIQNHSSNEQITQLSASANDLIGRAESLQTQNRELEEQNSALREENEAMAEELEKLKAEGTDVAKLKQTVDTYEALTTALTCTTREGNLSFSKAMETLKFNQKYLSEPAKQLYRTLLTETTGE